MISYDLTQVGDHNMTCQYYQVRYDVCRGQFTITHASGSMISYDLNYVDELS